MGTPRLFLKNPSTLRFVMADSPGVSVQKVKEGRTKQVESYLEWLKTNTPREPEDFLRYQDLPTWVRTAVAMVFIGGFTQKESARRHGKSATTLSKYINHSPAVKDWVEELEKFAQSPEKMAEAAFKSNAFGVSMEYFAAYEKAVESGDFNAVAKMSQDMLDRAGVTKKKEKPSTDGLQVTLNIQGGGVLDVPEVSASFVEVEADFEMVDDET